MAMEPLAMLNNSKEFPDHIDKIALSESFRTRSNQQRCKVYGREELLVLNLGRLPQYTGKCVRLWFGRNHNVFRGIFKGVCWLIKMPAIASQILRHQGGGQPLRNKALSM